MYHQKENILKTKSYKFAIRIAKLSRYLTQEKKDYVLSRQILRSGTSIGALVRESEYGQSKPDFINKLSIALKEANETEYWIDLLKDTGYINSQMHISLKNDCEEVIKILTASIKTSKASLKK
jgi:four helix bundle protein